METPKGLMNHVFAMYHGRKNEHIRHDGRIVHYDRYLALYSLSQISEDQSADIAKWIWPWKTTDVEYSKKYISFYKEEILEHLKGIKCVYLYQYLLEKGFAVSVHYQGKDYTVEELVSMQIIKIIK